MGDQLQRVYTPGGMMKMLALALQQRQQAGFIEHSHSQLLGFSELATSFLARY